MPPDDALQVQLGQLLARVESLPDIWTKLDTLSTELGGVREQMQSLASEDRSTRQTLEFVRTDVGDIKHHQKTSDRVIDQVRTDLDRGLEQIRTELAAAQSRADAAHQRLDVWANWLTWVGRTAGAVAVVAVVYLIATAIAAQPMP